MTDKGQPGYVSLSLVLGFEWKDLSRVHVGGGVSDILAAID